jgi:hypothetical protein
LAPNCMVILAVDSTSKALKAVNLARMLDNRAFYH